MSKIAIITDSDASLPQQVAEQYHITQVPITIHFEDKSFTTGVDIDDALVFKQIDQRNKLPTTSAPSPHAFASAYEAALSGGAESIVCLCVSSKISATYQAALTARESFASTDIRVVDTLSLSMGQGFMVLAAAEAALAGANIEQVLAAADRSGQCSHLYAVLSTLKYLALSGRVSKLAAGMADTLNIKPILTVQNGKLELLERIRTRKKAIERMFELTRLSLNGQGIERAAIIHVNHPEGALELKESLQAKFTCMSEILTCDFTPGLSVHAGSGVVGVALVRCA